MYVVSQSLHCLGHMTFLSVLPEIWQIYLFVAFYSIAASPLCLTFQFW